MKIKELPYIYKITNLINGKIYIGQHDGNKKNYFGGGTMLKRAIKKYGKKNFKKEIIKQGNFNQMFLNELEIHYIRLYAPNNTENSYNILPGGKMCGFKGCKHTKEAKKKIAKASKNRKSNLGKKVSVETKLKMSIARKGRIIPREQVERSREGKKKPILQYDLQNNFIREWDSALTVCKELNLLRSNISRCCNNKQTKSGGFKWKFKN